MRKISIILFFIPMIAMAQTQDVYIKLGNPGMTGDVTAVGYQGCVQALTMTSYGANNTLLDFTMNICKASTELKNALTSGYKLPDVKVSVVKETQPLMVLYEINMRNVRILKCSESMGCNSIMTTSVSLSADNIEWVYYQHGPTGTVIGVTKSVYNTPVNVQMERRK